MTDPQLANSNHNSSNGGGSNNGHNPHNQYNNGAKSVHNNNVTTNNNSSSHNHNNNNNGEPKYLHKKFKKVATSQVANETACNESGPQPVKEAPVSPLTAEAQEVRKTGKICPYCKLSCAKPSVLLKHIRAHTNERPYPCVPCGFAFKTKSNLYKHCKSRSHALKTDATFPVPLHLSEDSDVSLSDSASNDTGTPPPPPPHQTQTELTAYSPNLSPIPSPSPSPGLRALKIYKPKFHTALQQCIESAPSKPNAEQLQEHIERIITDNRAIVETSDPLLHKLLHRQQSLVETAPRSAGPESRKRCRSEGTPEAPIMDSNELTRTSSPEHDYYGTLGPLPSPGPLLGTTRLVGAQDFKRPRLEELSARQHQKLGTLQMFGGQVRILDGSGASKTVRIEPRGSPAEGMLSANSGDSGSELAAVVVRSGLHSGGTMLHKPAGALVAATEAQRSPISLVGIAPNISAPSLAPSLGYLRPGSILHAGRLIPYVPGMPGPQSLVQPLDLMAPSAADKTCELAPGQARLALESPEIVIHAQTLEQPSSKFLRPSSLPLKPGTFTPKRHHGITPTANTLPLISPETPRPKKSYGQLYLNGHAYTYLGLKCSTRLFYCTLNRPQPMYVTQQHGLSMYSNWKICKEAPPELELAHYESRHRPPGYTLACTRHEDILTHSSQRPSTPSSPDSGLESDSQEKRLQDRVKIFDGGFESNEDYTYVRGRGRGRYVCEECGIRCKKPSMLKKHIRTHTDVRPYTCKHCAFSFKTKGNLTKHMKSKAHYKKCVELKVLPVPTSVCDENIDKEALSQLTLTGACTDDTSSSEDESEAEGEAESDESGSEEHEAAQSLLSLARPNARQLPGLLPSARPATYPYGRSPPTESSIPNTLSVTSPADLTPQSYYLGTSLVSGNETRLSVIRSCRKDEAVTPIDLTIRQPKLKQRASSTDILAEMSGPALLQTIVQTVERLPIQSRSEQPAEGQMLQAYLTERYMMDSKMKQLYRVNSKESEKPIYFESAPDPKVFAKEPVADPLKTTGVPREDPAEPSETKLEVKESSQVVSTSPHLVVSEAVKQQQQPPPPPPAHPAARKVVVSGTGFGLSLASHNAAHTPKLNLEFFQRSNVNVANYVGMTEDSRNVCSICNKVFSKSSQLSLHINIHYFERPFRCESCGTSFRTKGHLTKHERSTLHHNKVSMTSTFGAATASNPRPFKCTDCMSAFRIHGHLAKHLRSKMHIMKLECLRKLPFGTYAEIERSGVNLNDIDTTDCDTSLTSLQVPEKGFLKPKKVFLRFPQIMAQKLCEKDPGKLGQWEPGMIPNHAPSGGETSSDESDANPARSMVQCTEANMSQNFYIPGCGKSSDVNVRDVRVDEVRNGPIYKCHLCTTSLRNLNELHVHCFVEHNIESGNGSTLHTSSSIDEKINEKDIHHFKNIENCPIKESESGQKIDAT